MYVALVGCVRPAPPFVIGVQYNDADFAPFKGPGPATLHGQAFMKTVGGDVKTCAGNAVYLMPVNWYNNEILNSGAQSFANRDDRADAYTLHTVCDSQGNFTFEHIAAKSWWVLTDVTWGVPNNYGGIDPQGGMMKQVVILHDGDNSTVLSQ